MGNHGRAIYSLSQLSLFSSIAFALNKHLVDQPPVHAQFSNVLPNVLLCLQSDRHLRKCPVGETGSNVLTRQFLVAPWRRGKNILWPAGTRHFGRFVARSFGIGPNCHDLARVVFSRGDLIRLGGVDVTTKVTQPTWPYSF